MTPIERAAEKVREEMSVYRASDGLWMTEGGRVSDEYFHDIVRAVLTALREPSEAMLDQAEDREAQNPRATARHMWQAMIDAALADVP